MATQTTMNQTTPTDELQGYADKLVQSIQQLRKQQAIAEQTPIEVYLTNTEIVRSLFKQYRSYIEEKTNAADLVQVNLDAGQPLPENLAQTELHIGDQDIVIAINESGKAK